MKKITVAIIVLILAVFASGCSKKVLPYRRLQELTTQHHELKPFKSVVVKGNGNFDLVNGAYAINTTGIAGPAQNYQATVFNQTLYVKNLRHTAGMSISIAVPDLKNLTVFDDASVTSKNFKANNLQIVTKGNGSVDLEGHVGVSKILQGGTGRIDVSWIASDEIFVESNNSGPVYLSGIVNNAVVNLSSDAQVDTRYLRAKNATISAAGAARADVFVLDTLNAFATDSSNIYYYKRPDHINVDTKKQGNVLYGGWIR